jgi:hypothetical protein
MITSTLLLTTWPSWTGRVELATVFWTLHRSLRTAQCVLYTHPSGWELCLHGEHDFPRSMVCRTAAEVVDRRDSWRATLVRDGWRPEGLEGVLPPVAAPSAVSSAAQH